MAVATPAVGVSGAFNRPGRHGATRTGRTCDYYDADILHIIAHPWLEAVAKQALSTSAVTLFQTALLNAWPDPDADPDVTDLQQMEGYHTDMQYTGEDLFATPRRFFAAPVFSKAAGGKRAPFCGATLHRKSFISNFPGPKTIMI